VRPPDPRDAALLPFEPPECAAAEATEHRPAALKRIVERDRATNETVYTIGSGGTELTTPKLIRIKAIGLEIGQTMLKRFRIGDDDPEMAQAEIIHKTWFRRDPWQTRIETRTRLSSTADEFLLEADLEAYDNDAPFFARSWSRRIKREQL
jgi:hypothetical protein